jgi:hypothetical protein
MTHVSSEQFRQAREQYRSTSDTVDSAADLAVRILNELERFYERKKREIADSRWFSVYSWVKGRAATVCIAKCVLGTLGGDPSSAMELLLRVADRFGIISGCEVALP